MMIDTRWRRDTVLPAERLKPPAPGVVEVSSDGTERAAAARQEPLRPRAAEAGTVSTTVVTRLFVRQAASQLARSSVWEAVVDSLC